MLIAVNPIRIGKGKIVVKDRPEAEWRSEYREFNGKFENRNISPEELMQLAVNQWAFCAQHHSYRHSKNFTAGQHLGLDIDNGGMNLDQIAGVPFFQKYASFAYTTPSHTEQEPKIRVIFALDRPIHTKEKYAELAESLVNRFGTTDKSVKDPARFFYGGGFGCMSHWWGNTLTLEDAATELVHPNRRIIEQHRLAAEVAAANRIILPNERVSPALLRAHSGKLLERVRTAPKGEKHFTRRNVAVTFGGYIASGYYNESDVLLWLEAAVAANSDIPEAAMGTIRSGIAWGKSRPLHFEEQRQEEYPELARVHPPLTPSQTQHVISIIKDRELKAYHDGMTAGQRQGWYDKGMDDVIIDMLGLGYRQPSIDEETGEMIGGQLTIPFMRGNEVENVEYRDAAATSYALAIPSLYAPESGKPDSPTLIFSDTLTAIRALLYFGHMFTIAGMPQMTLNPQSLDGIRDPILVLEPGVDPLSYGLKFARGKVRCIGFPFSVEKMIEYGTTAESVASYVRTARIWS